MPTRIVSCILQSSDANYFLRPLLLDGHLVETDVVVNVEVVLVVAVVVAYTVDVIVAVVIVRNFGSASEKHAGMEVRTLLTLSKSLPGRTTYYWLLGPLRNMIAHGQR